MKITLLLVFLFLAPSPPDAFQIVWCSADKAAKDSLHKELEKLEGGWDSGRLEALLSKWEAANKIKNPLVVIKTGDGFYKWPFPGSKRSLIYKESAGVLGTRSMKEPTREELNCFFSDTLVIVDTLRFYTGLAKSHQFVLRIGAQDHLLPFDDESEEIILTPELAKGKQSSVYQSALILEKKNGALSELAKCTIYVLNSEERRALQTALVNKKDEIADCDSLMQRSVAFLTGFYGGKHCGDKATKYHHAQGKVLERLTNCR